MKWWDKVKKYFRKEASYLVGKDLDTIFDHERINVDKSDFDRIKDTMRMYAGEYDKVNYINWESKNKEREYFHLNMMKEVAKMMADVMLNEDAEIVIDNADADNFIQNVFKDTKFIRNLRRYLEPALALGGLSAKPYYDSGAGKIEYSWSLADTFIPLRSNTNGISECVMPSVTTEVEDGETYYYTLLEFHEWGDEGKYTITNELYKSKNKDKVGKRVRLSDLYEELEEVSHYSMFTRPDFSYLQPSGFNNINPESPLGLGVCDNAKTTLKQINDVYDQFHWEIKQGKRRLLASDHLTKVSYDKNGIPKQRFDEDTDVFVPVKGEMDQVIFQNLTIEIRSEQYIQSINKFMATLEMQTGLSAGTFTFDAEGVKTATEVVSRDSTTYRTRNSHLTNVEQFIKDLIISTLELARETFGLDGHPLYSGEIPTEETISINFDDGVFTDRNTELEFWGKAKNFGFTSAQGSMQKLFKMTEEEAAKEFRKIKLENTLMDPFENEKRAESSLLGGAE